MKLNWRERQVSNQMPFNVVSPQKDHIKQKQNNERISNVIFQV